MNKFIEKKWCYSLKKSVLFIEKKSNENDMYILLIKQKQLYSKCKN